MYSLKKEKEIFLIYLGIGIGPYHPRGIFLMPLMFLIQNDVGHVFK